MNMTRGPTLHDLDNERVDFAGRVHPGAYGAKTAWLEVVEDG